MGQLQVQWDGATGCCSMLFALLFRYESTWSVQMYFLRTNLRRFIVALCLLGCGCMVVTLGGNVVSAASPTLLNFTPSPTITGTPPTRTPTRTATITRTPTNTPTPTATPDCDDWRQWSNPAGAQIINPLYGVAAAAPDDVWAVGFTGGYGSTNPHVLIERWDGTEWNLIPVSDSGILQAVTVVAPDDVWAVGYYEDPARNLTMHWDGTSWSIVPSPYVQGVGNSLYGVAAAGPDDVWAVGTVQNQGRILRWDGTQWNIVPIPVFDYSFLFDVAVVAPDDVWAVGSVGFYDAETLILHWDGSDWTQVASPSPASYRNRLNAISVLDADDIWAAGWATEGQSTFSGTILHWDGTDWSVSPISGDSPETSGSTQLFGIAAASSTEAWAVGWELDWTVRKNTIMQWDGSTWTRIANTPNLSSYFNQLEGVTVVAPGEAWGVGHIGGNSSGQYLPQILRYGPQCATATPTVTGTPPTATSTGTSTPTSMATNTLPPTATATAIPTVCGVLLSDGFEGGSLGQFTNDVPICVSGGCNWRNSTATPHTGTRAAFAPNVSNVSDQRLVLSNPIVPTAGSLLTFWHSYDFEGLNGTYFDGGVLEASTNGGTNWFDMGSNIVSGGYVGAISPIFDNPLAGREAWGGNSGGYVQTIVNLSPYAGQDLLFRFREGTDSSLGAVGWRIDDIQVTGGAACPSVTVVAGTSTIIPLTSTAESTGTSIPSTSTSVPPTGSVPVPTDTATIPAATSTPEQEATATPLAGECLVQFSDVPEGSTFYMYVRCLACRSIITGYPDGTFRPNGFITRGQLAKIAANAAGLVGNPSRQTFEDVPASDPFYMYVERAAARGVLSGYPCGGENEPCGAENKPYFRPYMGTTRGQVAKVVANTSGMGDVAREVPTEDMFADVPEGSPFYDYIQMLTSYGVMAGYACGGEGEPCDTQNRPYFRPYNNVTRGQTSKIVSGAFYPNCQVP